MIQFQENTQTDMTDRRTEGQRQRRSGYLCKGRQWAIEKYSFRNKRPRLPEKTFIFLLHPIVTILSNP